MADTNSIRHLNRKQIARIFAHIVCDIGGCWNWTGNVSPDTGYPRIRFPTGGAASPKTHVHRIIAAWIHGHVPNGTSRDSTVVDHFCNNKRCCNPSHLRLVPPRVNVLRGSGPSAHQSLRTHCANGHPLGEMFYHPKSDRRGRRCPICVDAHYLRRLSPDRQAALLAKRERGSGRHDRGQSSRSAGIVPAGHWSKLLDKP